MGRHTCYTNNRRALKLSRGMPLTMDNRAALDCRPEECAALRRVLSASAYSADCASVMSNCSTCSTAQVPRHCKAQRHSSATP